VQTQANSVAYGHFKTGMRTLHMPDSFVAVQQLARAGFMHALVLQYDRYDKLGLSLSFLLKRK
jgi:hypothetical protein